MMYRGAKQVILWIILVFVLTVILSANELQITPFQILDKSLVSLKGFFQDPKNQPVICLCLAIDFVILVLLRLRLSSQRFPNREMCCICFVWLACGIVFCHGLPSNQALVLLGGATLGQATAGLASRRSKHQITGQKTDFTHSIVVVAILLLSLASLFKGRSYSPFQYRDQVRWVGIWSNPNIFGLLMAVGITLALGQAAQNLGPGAPGVKPRAFKLGSREPRPAKNEVWSWPKILPFIAAASFMAWGLLQTYSRGAWIASVVGIGFLFWSKAHPISPLLRQTRCPMSKVEDESHFLRGPFISRLKRNWIPAALILLSVLVLTFWQFRQAGSRPVRRVFSAVNAVDFSWRNRIAAWKGALRIAAESPWFGRGWNQPELIYENYYMPGKLSEGKAIEMNDYLMLAATLGIPALFCFGMYVWQSLIKNAKLKMQNKEDTEEEWLKTTCRAGAIVLLVGFWFDGGLFKLATGSTFWILLELGSTAWNGEQPSNEATKEMLPAN